MIDEISLMQRYNRREVFTSLFVELTIAPLQWSSNISDIHPNDIIAFPYSVLEVKLVGAEVWIGTG